MMYGKKIIKRNNYRVLELAHLQKAVNEVPVHAVGGVEWKNIRARTEQLLSESRLGNSSWEFHLLNQMNQYEKTSK